MAEKQGVKNVGLTWIWKEKFDEKDESKTKKNKKKKTNMFSRKNSA